MSLDKPVGELGEIPLKITVAVVLGVISTTLIILFVALNNFREEFKFVTAVIAGAGVIYAGYYTAASLRLSIEAKKREIEAKKREKAFDILFELNRIDMAEIRIRLEREMGNVPPNEQYDHIVKDAKVYAAIITLLGLYEDTAIAVKKGYVDEEVLFLSLGGLVPWTNKTFKAFIDGERTQFADDLLYTEMHDLASAWEGNKSLATGKDF